MSRARIKYSIQVENLIEEGRRKGRTFSSLTAKASDGTLKTRVTIKAGILSRQEFERQKEQQRILKERDERQEELEFRQHQEQLKRQQEQVRQQEQLRSTRRSQELCEECGTKLNFWEKLSDHKKCKKCR